MAECKTKDCKNEAEEGKEYCLACLNKRDANAKGIAKLILSALAIVGVPLILWAKSKK